MSLHERFDYTDSEALLSKSASLGVEIPFSRDLSILFDDVELAGRRAPNRFCIHPMEGCDATGDGAPTDLTFRRYERYGRGGSGLIWFEATAVTGSGRSSPRQLLLCDRTAGAFGRLADATRNAARASMGAGHEPVLIVQLTHPGRFCRPDGTPRPMLVRRNPVIDPLQGIDGDHPLLADDAIDRLQEEFEAAARLAARAGFDGVDIKGCHGYLASDLLAGFNRERSRYGGSFENRARFLLETVGRIGRRDPGLIVTSRINAFDGVAHPHGFGVGPADVRAGAAGGVTEDLSEPAELLKRLHALGAPLANVSIGIPFLNSHLGRPFDRPLKGARLPEEHPLAGVARLVRITGALQEAVPRLPLVGTGYSWLRQFFPHVGAGAVASGMAAFVGVGRIAFAYPDFVRDLGDSGSLDPEKVCVGCSSCSQIMRAGNRTGCVVRDAEIYGPEYRKGRRKEDRSDGD